MATKRFFICNQGHVAWPRLFDALLDLSSGRSPSCQHCKGDMRYELKFPFGLEAGLYHVRVLDVFLPRPIYSWQQKDGSTVSHYPFLVMVQGVDDEDIAAWWPYFHTIVKNGQITARKYGQWAPFFGQDKLASLLAQARKKGYSL